jgi:hypothetical protein
MLSLLMTTRTFFALLLALACSHLSAEPAPYYQWRSKVDGALACSQTPLGPGWEKASGPYRDSLCQRKSGAK